MAAFLVMLMQAGFALVETGLCRAKNAAHTMSMSLMIYALGCLSFWAYGFAIGWGNWCNAPVAPGWHSSLGRGTSVLASGWGLGAVSDAASGAASGAFRYGLIGLKGFFLNGLSDVGVLGSVLLHDGADERRGDDSHRRDGRTLALEKLLPVRTLGGAAVRHLRQLGVGRRLAGP